MTDTRHERDDRKKSKPEEETATAAHPAGPTVASPDAGGSEANVSAGDTGDDLAQLTAERDEYLDHLRRLQAEFDNYRKRVRRDADDLRLRAAEDVVESLLPVMDNTRRALEAAARHEEGQLIAGLELVARQLRDTLAGHGLEQLETAPGDLFDPTLHEAVMTQASDDHDEGAVLDVLEPGYLLHGRLLRPAKVVVTR